MFLNRVELNSPARLRDPLYSPAHATEAQLDGLPPVYLAVSGSEVMTGQCHVTVDIIKAQK